MMGAWLVAPPPLVNDNTVAVGGTPDSDQAGGWRVETLQRRRCLS